MIVIDVHDDDHSGDYEDSVAFGPKHGHFEVTSGSPYKTIGTVHAEGRSSHAIVFDEPHPRGKDEHPSPVMYLLGSLVGCQLAVLCSCLEKSRVETYHIKADARSNRGWGEVAEEMPDATAQRIDNIDIDITVEVPEEFEKQAERCLEVYDTGCIVGQSLKKGIDYSPNTNVQVK